MSIKREAHAKASIQKGVDYLLRAQRPSGEFETFWSRSRNMSEMVYAESPFVTGMVLLALSGIRSKNVDRIRTAACTYLKAKRKEEGLFSFLEAGIDTDLDDTCLLNWILQHHEQRCSLDYKALAQRVACLPKERALYLTWIRADEKAANDVDPCISVNVVRFLDLNRVRCAATLGALCEYLRSGGWAEGTLYYDSPFAFVYLVCSLSRTLRSRIFGDALSSGWFFGALNSIECTRTLSALDAALLLYVKTIGAKPCKNSHSTLTELMDLQNPDGGWPNVAAFRAFNYWGSPSLVTAIAVQALAEYQAARRVR